MLLFFGIQGLHIVVTFEKYIYKNYINIMQLLIYLCRDECFPFNKYTKIFKLISHVKINYF